MAVVSAAPTTATNAPALTPPHSSDGDDYAWDGEHADYTQNGGSYHVATNDIAAHDVNEKGALDGEPLGRHQTAPQALGVHEGLEESPMDRYRLPQNASANELNKRAAAPELYGSNPDDVSSKWIHRDKLARIENEELQAAGIILPKTRARSRPRRDVSVDGTSSHRTAGASTGADGERQSRPRNNSSYSDRRVHDPNALAWDLRLPEEIETETYFVPAGSTKGVSRIPVAKLSPAPIPMEHIERDAMLARKRDNSFGTEDNIAYLKPRSRSNSLRDTSTGGRSASDSSPKKPAVNGSAVSVSSTTGPRKTSASSRGTSTGRPKTRNGSSKDANGSTTAASTRPSTRSGERDLAPGASGKHPEGEPPWMISAYRPDPRLPPDQQLLPTVARRLQQEKWEREGKFGNIYDKEFRPLTDNGFLTPPEMSESATTAAPTSDTAEKHDTWPLKVEIKSPSLPTGRTGSYSTIPRIQDRSAASPLPSPRGPIPQTPQAAPTQTAATPLKEEEPKDGCGCCIVM